MYAAYQELGSLKEADKFLNINTQEKITIDSIYFNLGKRKSTEKTAIFSLQLQMNQVLTKEMC